MSGLVPLGYDNYVRVDKIFAVNPLPRDLRRPGARTRVWIEGMDGPVIASRSARAILSDMGVLRQRKLPAAQLTSVAS